MTKAKKPYQMAVMHPLPRVNEIRYVHSLREITSSHSLLVAVTSGIAHRVQCSVVLIIIIIINRFV